MANKLDFSEFAESEVLDFSEFAEIEGTRPAEGFKENLDIPIRDAITKIGNIPEIGLHPIAQAKNLAGAGEDIAKQVKDGLLASLTKRILGSKTETDDEKFKDVLKQDRGTVAGILDEMEARGEDQSDEYQKYVTEFDRIGEEINQVETNKTSAWETIKNIGSFVMENPDVAGAELINGILSDPELALAPLGYAAPAKHLAKMGKTAETMAGLTGVAATAAAIEAPLSIERQLEESGEVTPTQVMADMAVAGAFSVPIVAGAKGVQGGFKYMGGTARKILNTPDLGTIGAAAVKGEKIAEEAIKRPSALKRFGSDVINTIAGKSITPVVKVARKSPSLQKVVDMLYPDETGKRAIGPVFHEKASINVGHSMVKIQDALDGVVKPISGKVPRETELGIISALRGEKVSSKMTAIAKPIRKVLDDIHSQAKKAGLDIGYIENYFPRIYKSGKLLSVKSQRAFKDVLTRNGIDELDAEDIIRNIIDQDGVLSGKKAHGYKVDLDDPNVLKKSFWAAQGRKRSLAGASTGRKSKFTEMTRKLNKIPDSELAPFLEDNLYDVLMKYVENVSHRTEWVKTFGKEGGKLNNQIGKAVVEMRQAGVNGGDIKQAIRRLYDISDALQKNYHPVNTKRWRNFNRWATTYQNFRTLAFVTIASLPEVWTPLLRAPLSANLKAIPATLNHAARGMVRTVYKKFPKAQATRALEEVGIGLDAAITERIAEAFGGELTKSSKLFFKAIGLDQWTRFTRVAANETGKNMIVGHLRALAKSKKLRSNKYQRELNELGIDVDRGIKWVKEGASKADPFFNEIKAGGLRFTNEVIMNPQVVNRPMWHSNPHFHTIMQLKGFQTTFGNTVVKRMARELFQRGLFNSMESAARYASVVGMMIYTAMLGNELRESLIYGPKGNPRFKGEKPTEKYFRALERTGFTGAYQFGIDATLAHRFGSSGFGALLGPTASQAEEFLEGVGEAREGNIDKLRREAVKAIPIVNRSSTAREFLEEALGKQTP